MAPGAYKESRRDDDDATLAAAQVIYSLGIVPGNAAAASAPAGPHSAAAEAVSSSDFYSAAAAAAAGSDRRGSRSTLHSDGDTSAGDSPGADGVDPKCQLPGHCDSCGETKTPTWRPIKKTPQHSVKLAELCNACGIRCRKHHIVCFSCHVGWGGGGGSNTGALRNPWA